MRKCEKIRKDKNLTQEKLAILLWIKRPRIIEIEKWNQSPTLNTLKMIADWLWDEVIEFFRE